jgi:hypothetical protein
MTPVCCERAPVSDIVNYFKIISKTRYCAKEYHIDQVVGSFYNTDCIVEDMSAGGKY